MLRTLTTSCAFAIHAAGSNAPMMDPTTIGHSEMGHAAHMKMMEAAAQREAMVAARGKDVMPFNLVLTTHIFSKTAEGSTQQVVALKSTDKAQVNLTRCHLQEIREQFLMGDFSGPSHIHGMDMPGLAELKAAKPGQISIDYKDVVGAGQWAVGSGQWAVGS